MALSYARDKALVFANHEGAVRHPEQFSRSFAQAQARCRRDLGDDAPPPIRLHDLRHTHATLLQMSGVASDATFPGKPDRGAVRESGSGSPRSGARWQGETAGQAGRDITVLQRLPRCRSQFGCIAGQNDAATATPNSINEDEASEQRVLRGDPFSMVGKLLSTSLAKGTPVKVVSERLGHASPTVTLSVYAHVLPGDQREAAVAFAALIGEA